MNLDVVMVAGVVWRHLRMATAARAEMAECRGVAAARGQELTLERRVELAVLAAEGRFVYGRSEI